MEYKTGCLFCGTELTYATTCTTMSCVYCGVVHETSIFCPDGHFVCDTCHNGSANELIERYCTTVKSDSPVSLAWTLMKNPAMKMHGPEHHFLVPAVLLAAYYGVAGGEPALVKESIHQARVRAEEVKGGFCGFQGACGAAIGAGIFMSIVVGATPLADRQRQLANLMTAECLCAIAENGGARCCKREVFQALTTAVTFIRRELGVALAGSSPPACSFFALNRECSADRCPFSAGEKRLHLASAPARCCG
jgi:hypothetical protein